DVTSMYSDYERIYRELLVNRVQTKNYVENVKNNIVNNLREAKETEHPAALKAVQELRDALESKEGDVAARQKAGVAAGEEAQKRLNVLIKRLKAIVDHMEKLTTIHKLIAMLVAIQEVQLQQHVMFKGVEKTIEDKLLEQLLGKGKDDPGKKEP